MSSLAREHNVTTRTISRDIAVLEEAHIPIEKEVGYNGGISIMKGYKLDKSYLTEEDRQMLRKFFLSLEKGEDSQRVRHLIYKLGL